MTETSVDSETALKEWEENAIKMDSDAARTQRVGDVPPPRRKFFVNEKTGARSEHNGGDGVETASVSAAAAATAAAKSIRIPGWDYKSWDNFDVENEIAKIDREEKEKIHKENAEKALKEKEKGNNFFKKGKYDDAIESYTRAMKLDPTSAIYPANRALCHLKLSKFKEAEEDSTIAIKLDPKYSKAYFRRASARKSLKKYPHAIDDLNKLIELEPTNKQAVTEKLAITKLLAEEFKRREEEERRLEEGDDGDDDDENEKETKSATKKEENVKKSEESEKSSSQPIKTKSTAPGFDMIESQTRYFKDKKEPTMVASPQQKKESEDKNEGEKCEKLPESKKPKHVEEQDTANDDKREKEKEKVNTLMPKFPSICPKTLQEFILLWKSYEPDKELRTKLLFLLPPEKVPQFFRDSMTPAFLSEVISVLQVYGTKIDAQKTLALMEALPNVGRFMMLWFGLTQKDKQNIKDLIDNQLKANETIRKKWKL